MEGLIKGIYRIKQCRLFIKKSIFIIVATSQMIIVLIEHFQSINSRYRQMQINIQLKKRLWLQNCQIEGQQLNFRNQVIIQLHIIMFNRLDKCYYYRENEKNLLRQIKKRHIFPYYIQLKYFYNIKGLKVRPVYLQLSLKKQKVQQSCFLLPLLEFLYLITQAIFSYTIIMFILMNIEISLSQLKIQQFQFFSFTKLKDIYHFLNLTINQNFLTIIIYNQLDNHKYTNNLIIKEKL
ncbi:transmembrane protein, putative (macronuclear) [Tetrahymena thermophila SB210]|uniref:Transmembrane protein, putative n=1 Tax=Tetrahymena thermophila (strain SB210) TaxID=312017 RepID=W7XHQ3_TETTS|nr:transmembrane protein, putative [Tetrahymena thermophila SB210]EWS73966.1 transmembrane protein, putative [Tetrahymena thermophila SB210]|eukprot:XP_012653507.1 transmembrane protein, putative [Tetrahymena thermophila SB210]